MAGPVLPIPTIYVDFPKQGRLLLDEITEDIFKDNSTYEYHHGKDIFGKDYSKYENVIEGLFIFREGKLTTIIIEGDSILGFATSPDGERETLPMTKSQLIRVFGKPDSITFNRLSGV
jgi:hypothetical protein